MLDYTNSATIYVSQEIGNDYNSGFAPANDGYGAGPVKTLKRVRNLLYTMRACGNTQPMTVRFMGDYYLETSLNPGFEEAGNYFGTAHAMKNVTFESYGKERSRIIGGKKLTGFQKDVFRGVECVSLYIPEVKEGTWRFTDLYVNGKRAALARYPKDGTLTAVATENDYPQRSYMVGSKWFVAHKEDLQNVEGIENAWVSFYHYWIDEHTPVESYDPETGKLEMQKRSRFLMTTNYDLAGKKGGTANLHYYLENVAAGFSQANDWYLDVTSGMLYYIPQEQGMDPEQLEIFAPTLQTLIEVRGTPENKLAGIRFRNLDFICSKGEYRCTVINKTSFVPEGEDERAADYQSAWSAGGAIRFEYAEDCSMYNCTVSCTGCHAVEIAYGCDSVRVENCRLEKLGGGGVKILGRAVNDPAEWETGHCIIRNNLISHCGERYACACGILLCHSAHNELSDNEICYTDYTGISVGWVWSYQPNTTYGNIIRNNHIHHIGMGKLSDMGGIYLLGYQDGTIVEGNHIHDINSNHYGGWGLYPDESASHITMENNLIYNCKSSCYHQHYGSYNTLRGNVFGFGNGQIIQLTQNEAHMGVVMEENTFITDGQPIYGKGANAHTTGFTGSMMPLRASRNRIWDVNGEPCMMQVADDKGNAKQVSLAQWQKNSGQDFGTVIEKPENIVIDVASKTLKIKE